MKVIRNFPSDVEKKIRDEHDDKNIKMQPKVAAIPLILRFCETSARDPVVTEPQQTEKGRWEDEPGEFGVDEPFHTPACG